MTLKGYYLIVQSDDGPVRFSTTASSMKSAANIIIKAENCPRSAIKKIYEVPLYKLPSNLNWTQEFKFWVIYRGSVVKLTVEREGEKSEITTYEWHSHDEGWSSEQNRYWIEDNFLFCEWLNEGRDCDGPLSYSGITKCHLSQLKMHDNPYIEKEWFEAGVMFPVWEKVESWQRDEYAEAAGY